MELGLTGKCALVTGGSQGIGRAIALELAREGCHMAICARREEALQKTVCEIEAVGVEALGLVVDVLQPEQVAAAVDGLLDRWGGVDILVNNVGGEPDWRPLFEEAPDSIWLEVFEKNLMAAVRFTRGLVPEMEKRGWGRVVSVASLQGREGGGRPWYNLSKSAEISLMKTLGMDREMAQAGITFNSIAPGAVLSPGNGWDRFRVEDPEGFIRKASQRPQGRLGTPEEIAHVVAFICSEKASLLNGACIPVDGAESRSF